MTGFTDFAATRTIDNWTGKTAMPALATPGHTWVALFTAVGIDAGTGFTEASGGSYARVDTNTLWNAAAASAPSSTSNSGAITFPTSTGSWGTVIAFGIYDAATAGNLLWWDYLGNFPWQPTTVSLASPGILTVKAHGFSAADLIIFSTEYGGTAPSFSQSNFTGQLAVVSPATDSFSVTNAATAVNTSSTGSGLVRKITAQSIPSGVTASFAGGTPGALVITLA